MHFAKIETLQYMLHHTADLFILQVSNGTFMGVVYLGGVGKIALFDVLSYFFIGIPEGSPCKTNLFTSSTLKRNLYFSSCKISFLTSIPASINEAILMQDRRTSKAGMICSLINCRSR